jgi:hypothetical protein
MPKMTIFNNEQRNGNPVFSMPKLEAADIDNPFGGSSRYQKSFSGKIQDYKDAVVSYNKLIDLISQSGSVEESEKSLLDLIKESIVNMKDALSTTKGEIGVQNKDYKFWPTMIRLNDLLKKFEKKTQQHQESDKPQKVAVSLNMN